jgi:DNA repair protein RadD
LTIAVFVAAEVRAAQNAGSVASTDRRRLASHGKARNNGICPHRLPCDHAIRLAVFVPTPSSNAATWQLRSYQRAAVDATLRHFRATDDPACLVLPTGAGKSLIIAELARLARGRVLVLAHVKELCEQNYEKFTRSGANAGLYVAGLKRKELDEAVTFASVQSVQRNLSAFTQPISLLIIDECHRLSDADGGQFQQVIQHFKALSPRLKVLGVTATPYRLGQGWIYRRHYAGVVRSGEPRPFERCVYEVSLRELIHGGFLTAPTLIDAPVAQYDFSSLIADDQGRLPERAVNALLVQHVRVTESIVAQVRALAEQRRGVMLFAATVSHAKEVASYLPASETALVLGDTPSAQRDDAIARFKARELKYLVNVSVLTTGFDAPHVDMIAIMRRTDSVSLFQQIAGRGLRTYAGKSDCLIIDYAGNGFNLFHPEVGQPRPIGTVAVTVQCPQCDYPNLFWGTTDARGNVTEHHGRRCQALIQTPDGEQQCSYRFRFKECGACGAECDIAARRCGHCEQALVDPDDQLKAALRLKDALVLRVAHMTLALKEQSVCVTYYDEDGVELKEYFDFDHAGQRAAFQRVFARRVALGASKPTQSSDTPNAGSTESSDKVAPHNAFNSAQAVVAAARHFRHPDFVVARKVKHHWRVQARMFDYAGRYRKANALY